MQFPFFKNITGEKKSFLPGISHVRSLFASKIFGSNHDNLEAYKKWVFRCINLISDESAAAKLRLYKTNIKNGEREEVTDHELLRLWNTPNPDMTRSEVVKNISSFFDLDGNSYLLLARDNAGKIAEVWPLRSDWVKVVASKDNTDLISGYTYYNGEKNVDLKKEDVIHFRLFNPKFFNELKGKGVVEAVIDIINEDDSIAGWNTKFFKNGAVPSGVLEYDGELDEDDRKRIDLGWKKQTAEPNNTPILHGGLTYKQTQMSQKDLAFIDQRKLNRDDLVVLFGVPKGLLIADDVNLANAKQALWVFTRFTIKPRLSHIADVLTKYLCAKYNSEGYEYNFEFDNPVPQDDDLKIRKYQAAANVWLTPNEIRQEEGYEPIEGGDELRPTNTNPLLTLSYGEYVKKKSLSERDEEGEAAWATMLKAQRPSEDKYRQEFRKYFSELRTRVKQNIEKSISTKAALNTSDEVALVVDLLDPLQRELWEQQGRVALKRLGLPSDYVITPKTATLLRKYNTKLAKQITKTSDEEIKRILADAIDEGVGVAETASRIDQYFDYADAVRASRIARSETIRTSNAAMEDAWVQSEVVEAKEWYTAMDERVCEYCYEMDGKVVGLGDNYFNKGDEFMGLELDFRDIGEPPLHTNCRCVLLPVLK